MYLERLVPSAIWIGYVPCSTCGVSGETPALSSNILTLLSLHSLLSLMVGRLKMFAQEDKLTWGCKKWDGAEKAFSSADVLRKILSSIYVGYVLDTVVSVQQCFLGQVPLRQRTIVVNDLNTLIGVG